MDDPEPDEPSDANLSQQKRISRLAEASGMTEAEISALRNDGNPDDPEGDKKSGWGTIAKMLGLHPGVLGHGTGYKFMPDLPEMDEDATDAARTARERIMDRKAERREAKVEAKQSRRDLKAVKRGKTHGKPAKPERHERPKKTPKNRKRRV